MQGEWETASQYWTSDETEDRHGGWMTMATCFPVLGVPRSGTSCVAGILHRLGIFMGEQFYPTNEMNPTGFWMDLEFEGLFDSDFMPTTWTIKPVYDSQLQELLKRRTAAGIDWGFKVSKTALLVPLVEKAGVMTKLIITQRPGQASKASIGRFGVDAVKSDWILSVASSAIAACRQRKSRAELIVDYDSLVTSPQKEVERIAEFVGRKATQDAVDFVEPSLRHYL